MTIQNNIYKKKISKNFFPLIFSGDPLVSVSVFISFSSLYLSFVSMFILTSFPYFGFLFISFHCMSLLSNFFINFQSFLYTSRCVSFKNYKMCLNPYLFKWSRFFYYQWSFNFYFNLDGTSCGHEFYFIFVCFSFFQWNWIINVAILYSHNKNHQKYLFKSHILNKQIGMDFKDYYRYKKQRHLG